MDQLRRIRGVLHLRGVQDGRTFPDVAWILTRLPSKPRRLLFEWILTDNNMLFNLEYLSAMGHQCDLMEGFKSYLEDADRCGLSSWLEYIYCEIRGGAIGGDNY